MGTGMPLDMAAPDADPPVLAGGGDLAPLTLVTEGELSGLDEDGNVALSVARVGQIVYTFDDELEATDMVLEGTDPMKAKEWNELTLTFAWEPGEPMLGMGSVTVSYHPVSDDASDIPRFASGPTNRDQPARLQYRTGHHECLGGIWLLHHRVQRYRCS